MALFINWARIETKLGVTVHFCHPYSAYERGTVENRHKSLREFFPKGMDFTTITDAQLKEAEDYLNNLDPVPKSATNYWAFQDGV
jgi:IS30 family transposase